MGGHIREPAILRKVQLVFDSSPEFGGPDSPSKDAGGKLDILRSTAVNGVTITHAWPKRGSFPSLT